MAQDGGSATRAPRMNNLTKEEKKSVTHGDFWVPEREREVYKRALRALNEHGVPYVVAGAYAIYEHTGIYRDTKDLDIFVQPERTIDAARVLRDAGFTTRLEQPHWLAKAFQGEPFVDLIFGMGNGLALIDEGWYRHIRPAILAATPVRVAPAGSCCGIGCILHERHRQDMGDIVHRHCVRRPRDEMGALARAGRRTLAAVARPGSDLPVRLSGTRRGYSPVGSRRAVVARIGGGRTREDGRSCHAGHAHFPIQLQHRRERMEVP